MISMYKKYIEMISGGSVVSNTKAHLKIYVFISMSHHCRPNKYFE